MEGHIDELIEQLKIADRAEKLQTVEEYSSEKSNR
jgi:hypothetical protein